MSISQERIIGKEIELWPHLRIRTSVRSYIRICVWNPRMRIVLFYKLVLLLLSLLPCTCSDTFAISPKKQSWILNRAAWVETSFKTFTNIVEKVCHETEIGCKWKNLAASLHKLTHIIVTCHTSSYAGCSTYLQ